MTPDRRPLINLGVAYLESVTAANPHGWIEPLRGAKGRAVEWPIMFAESIIPMMQDVGAQGLIVWNGEGASRYNPLGFEGNPSRWATRLSEFAGALRAAGFGVGCCIRPTRIAKDENGKPYHVEPWDVVGHLIARIDAAIAKGAGDYVYIDTNGDWLFTRIMDARIIRAVHNARPNVLLVPEHETPDGQYRDCSMPYRNTSEGLRTTPAGGEVVNLFFGDEPGSRPSDALLNNLREDLAAGSIPMVRAWASAPEIAVLKELMSEQRNA